MGAQQQAKEVRRAARRAISDDAVAFVNQCREDVKTQAEKHNALVEECRKRFGHHDEQLAVIGGALEREMMALREREAAARNYTAKAQAEATEPLRRGFFGRLKWLLSGR